eukprot:CAMPEP_0181322414 /NCGR_PEP_ID=MMETSP1101-20121128/19217_1 /TAXON_ID=46948 /ORGANISM="Rhodomonas abbreviata, Strain Caron Lab Isolate" /LENGTH=128 /DNA_ID=CAMNT_0023430329 /DNA_START=1589 /DNA_END=1975 /DNA_ORIENTATION=-
MPASDFHPPCPITSLNPTPAQNASSAPPSLSECHLNLLRNSESLASSTYVCRNNTLNLFWNRASRPGAGITKPPDLKLDVAQKSGPSSGMPHASSRAHNNCSILPTHTPDPVTQAMTTSMPFPLGSFF